MSLYSGLLKEGESEYKQKWMILQFDDSILSFLYQISGAKNVKRGGGGGSQFLSIYIATGHEGRERIGTP